MPCRDYDSTDRNNSFEQEQRDRLARIACKAMTELVKHGKADFLLLGDEEVRVWWEKHQIADRAARELKERQAAERKAKKELARKKAALIATMSAEDRKILGL